MDSQSLPLYFFQEREFKHQPTICRFSSSTRRPAIAAACKRRAWSVECGVSHAQTSLMGQPCTAAVAARLATARHTPRAAFTALVTRTGGRRGICDAAGGVCWSAGREAPLASRPCCGVCGVPRRSWRLWRAVTVMARCGG